jgi:hypothetical protein
LRPAPARLWSCCRARRPALAWLRGPGRIDVLFSDMVMPAKSTGPIWRVKPCERGELARPLHAVLNG